MIFTTERGEKIVVDQHTPEWVVLKVIPHKDYTLDILFATSEKKRVNMRPVIERWISKNPKIFKRMNNVAFFMNAYADGTSVAWSDQIDIAPEYLYEHGVPIE